MPLYAPVVAPISQGFYGSFSWEPYGYVRNDKDPRRGKRYWFSRNATYRSHIHFAIDYPCPIGTPVRAMKAGTIISQGFDSSGAWLIYQRLRRGEEFDVIALYYHLKAYSFFHELNDKVRKGQKLALSGNTGYSTGPHLHQEIIRVPRGAPISQIYREGMRFDPKPFINGNARLRDIAP